MGPVDHLTLSVAPLPAGAKPFDVVGFGESSVDLLTVVDEFPSPDTKLTASWSAILPGGQAATAIVACARQGWRTRYVGCLGSDAWGDLIEEALAGEHVDVAAVRRRGARSRTAIVIVERATGRRTVIEHRDPDQRLHAEEMDASLVTSGRVLLVDATDVEASTAAARAARAAGIPTVVDIDRPGPGVEALLAEIDVLVVTEAFAGAYAGAASIAASLAALASRFRPAVAIATLGSLGSLALCQGREIRTPAPTVRVEDTTGAGDAFRGGFVSGWLRFGPETDLHTLLEYANAGAALNCVGVGAQTALPGREGVDALVTRTYRDQSK
jgi:ribokinase